VNGVLEVEPLKNEAPELNAASEEVGEEEKGVPQFWVTAMKTNEILAMQVERN
jgi:nucleosome assembly protein 1-like 1